MARRHRQRRGIVLLIILTLLTLLIVVGLTFALLSGQFRRGADASARKDRYGDPPSAVLERALYQLVRDTNDATSSIRSHSLLRDMYGESVRGRQTSAMVDSGGGQFLEFSAELALDANGDGSVNDEDAKTLAANWGSSGGWAQGDFNDDDVINAIDAAILAANWGYVWPGPGGAEATAVPEPGSLALLLGVAAALAVARRRA